jgi:transcriptional regulator with XRE-family HTH domain
MAEKQKISGAFGTVLRSYRLAKGMTQEQLDEQVEAVRSHICMLESGKNQPSLTMIFRLAAALGIKPGELMDAVAARLADK